MLSSKNRPLGIGIAIIQVFDIILHVATNQAEPLRITSNILILAWLMVLAFSRTQLRFQLVAAIVISTYLVLNLVFLAVNGVTNPEQGGGLRIMLLVLVALTVILSTVLELRDTRS